MTNSAGIAHKSHAKPKPHLDDTWMRNARCRTRKANFHSDNCRETIAAKRVCDACPVVADCLEYALERRELGVWGGKTEGERRELIRQRFRRANR